MAAVVPDNTIHDRVRMVVLFGKRDYIASLVGVIQKYPVGRIAPGFRQRFNRKRRLL
jgi:hypothetical protein